MNSRARIGQPTIGTSLRAGFALNVKLNSFRISFHEPHRRSRIFARRFPLVVAFVRVALVLLLSSSAAWAQQDSTPPQASSFSYAPLAVDMASGSKMVEARIRIELSVVQFRGNRGYVTNERGLLFADCSGISKAVVTSLNPPISEMAPLPTSFNSASAKVLGNVVFRQSRSPYPISSHPPALLCRRMQAICRALPPHPEIRFSQRCESAPRLVVLGESPNRDTGNPRRHDCARTSQDRMENLT